MFKELLKDEKRKFVFVEIKYFSMWYNSLSLKDQEAMHKIVNRGQVEFLIGGWSMNDEACTHYDEIINNFLIGHEFLRKTFNLTPRTSWQIDPFGHSAVNARIYKEMGFDNMFINRIDD